MKIRCNRSELMEALSVVSRAAAAKSPLPVIEGIYLKASQSGLYLCCYNLDMGIAKTISASVSETGSVVLPIRLCDIVRKLPADFVEISCDDKLVTSIKSGASDFSIIGIRADEFPELPTVDSEHSITIEQKRLRSMLTQTAYAISTSDVNPIYKGALFETEPGVMRIVTLDGYRLAIRREEIDQQESYSFVVPGKTLSEVTKVLEESDEEVEINVAKHNIVFYINGYSIISRLLSGEFLDYRTTFTTDYNFEVRIKTSALIAGVERMSLVISESYRSPVRCVFGGDKVKLSCETPIGRADDEISCRSDFADIEIGFNNKYMIDAFRAVDTDEVLLRINTGEKPVQVLPPEGDSFLFLLLPVRLSAKQTPGEEAPENNTEDGNEDDE